MELLKCDNCEKEMEKTDSFYVLNFNPSRFMTHNTTYYNYINGGPPVYHFCDTRCLSEWADKEK